MAVGKVFPKKVSVVARACACGQSPWFFLSLWLEEEERREGGGRRDTCGTVKVIRISCISTSNHPPLLLPTFLSSRPGKNGRRMKEEYRGDF